jgi:drug/metabolite transporter (DMT)-like permease
VTTAAPIQWLAAALLALAGVMQIVRARGMEEPLKAKNSRTSGALFLFSGAIFAALAADVI